MKTLTVAQSDLVSKRYFPARKKYSIPIKTSVGSGACKISAGDIQDLNLGIPVEVQRNLQVVSQLGLKELWLGLPAGEHNRWHHSVGVFNLGQIWMSAIEESGTVRWEQLEQMSSDVRESRLGWQGLKKVVGYSHLLHDYGHLPFAHLFHDILRSMNWIPDRAEAFGVEFEILGKRLEGLDKSLAGRRGFGLWDQIDQDSGSVLGSTGSNDTVLGLISGTHGLPWLNALCNSAIDCDKIDYLQFDKEFLASTSFPITSRLQQFSLEQWLSEFLSDQSVNHGGALCLNGLSARAAVDLWRERSFLYERFYLSPELRVPERMAFEIVKQFLLRCTFSNKFAQEHMRESLEDRTVFAAVYRKHSGVDDKSEELHPVDLHSVKFESGLKVIEDMSDLSSKDTHEWDALEKMFVALDNDETLDRGYREFLGSCMKVLRQHAKDENVGNEAKSLRSTMEECLVDEPFYFDVRNVRRVNELLRPLQHAYCSEALIDVSRSPSVLSAPRRYRGGFERGHHLQMDYNILVPEGKPSAWGPGRDARRPLTDEVVADLEQREARINVIAPGGAKTPKARFIQDRVRSTLLEDGIEVLRGGMS